MPVCATDKNDTSLAALGLPCGDLCPMYIWPMHRDHGESGTASLLRYCIEYKCALSSKAPALACGRP